ncbi:MAG: PQQ-binding-like beta-propeller repeat protein, partial [Pirellula staleyi]
YLAKRVWGETVVGMPSSDGEHVFSISELPAIDIADSFALGQNARVTKPQGTRNFNVMQCWSVLEEGKLKWEVGGQKSLTEPKLAGALFLGAPFPHDNELLVLGELNSDVYLFALTPQTGKLRWRQPIVTNYSSIAADQMRRSVGVVPAADGSIIVCPTLSGFVVGFDAVTHALLWSFQYPVKVTPGSSSQFNQFGQVEVGDFSPLLGRSADVSVLIQDGVVLFAPSDGENVYALSSENGKLLWQTGTGPSHVKALSGDWNIRYVAGAWNNMALIARDSSLVAMDLKTGRALWSTPALPNGNQIVGRGVRKGGNYYLPTSGQDILQIKLETGEIVETVRMEQPLGNLVSVGDRLLCASPFELDCYSVREAFQSQLKEELQKSSVSKSGLTRQAELALAKRDFDSALSFLEQAKGIDPNSAEVLMLMNKAGIAALTADFDKYVDR